MQVTVKLSSREGAAHISGILAGFTLLAKRGKLTLRVQDERQGSPLAREALLETEIDGRTVVFDLMDGYFYNDPGAQKAAHPLPHPSVGLGGAGGAAIPGLTGRVAAGERRPH